MIKRSISDYLQRHEAFLQELLQKAEMPASKLHEAMQYALFPGGKRFRPLLVYLCGEILDVNLACLDGMAAAVELTHTYSLVHDDLPAMDNDDLRRGKASCHKAFDEATAILVGDGLQALALEVLLDYLPQNLSPTVTVQVAYKLIKASGVSGMISGQSLDLQELARPAVDESALRFIHSLKTGRIILACVDMVIAASSANESLATALRNYASQLGLVFQMQDDYLDCYSDTHGKNRASDQINEKFTFANLYSGPELFKLIDQHYHLTLKALLPLGEKAENLRAFTCSLQRPLNFFSTIDMPL